MNTHGLGVYIPATPKDKRCTYRIKKVPNTTGYYQWKYPYRYYSEYKRPGGWFWWNINHAFNESLARADCEQHAKKRCTPPEPEQITSYINLGKLP